MKKYKMIFSIILSFLILFNSSLFCFASTIVGPSGIGSFSLNDNIVGDKIVEILTKKADNRNPGDFEYFNAFLANALQTAGGVVIKDPNALVSALSRHEALREIYNGNTDTDLAEYFMNGMSLNDDGTEITFSPEVVNLLRDGVKSYVDSQGYFYAYSTSFPFPSRFHSYNNYSFVKSKVVDSGYATSLSSSFGNPAIIYVYTGIGILDYANIVLDKTIETPEGIVYRCNVYSSNWNKLSSSYIDYRYSDKGSLTYSDDKVLTNFSFVLSSSYGMNYPYTDLSEPNMNYTITVFTSSPKRYRVFKTLADFKDYSVLQASYYAGKNFSTDHVTTPMTYSVSSIVNAPTYEMVTNYINEYNAEHQSFPSDGAIANYISGYAQNVGNSGGTNTGIDGNNNNTGVGNNNNVGGSGGSSSNGSGGSGGVSDVFGFLGGIGSVFGSLIKGVGELITNLLSALTEVMTSLTTEVPDSVIGFMGSLMSWVPPDIWILVRLAMVLGLVMAVVKKFF